MTPALTMDKKASEVRPGETLLLADGGTARVTLYMRIASPHCNAIDFSLDGGRHAVVPASAIVQVIPPARGH